MFFYFALIVLSLCVESNSYSAGAPLGACQTMLPNHNAATMNTEPPYQIVADKPEFHSTFATPITFTVASTNSENFKGLLLLAIDACTEEMGIGKFIIPEETKGVRLLDCFGKTESAVTHVLNGGPFKELSLQWLPPRGRVGHVIIKATIVMSKEVFWQNIRTEMIKDISAPECESKEFSNSTTAVPETTDAETTDAETIDQSTGTTEGHVTHETEIIEAGTTRGGTTKSTFSASLLLVTLFLVLLI